jgi:hypothetical protein
MRIKMMSVTGTEMTVAVLLELVLATQVSIAGTHSERNYKWVKP